MTNLRRLLSPQTAVFLILLTGFALRLWGIDFGLPYTYHADEPIVVNHALGYGTGDFNPHFFRIPPLASYLLFALYGLLFLAGKISGHFQSVHDFEFLYWTDPSVFYLAGRFFLGVLPGVCSIYLLYRVTRSAFGLFSSVLASFFFCIAFIHVRDSHYIYADIPLVLVMIAAFFSFFKISSGAGSFPVHALSGFMIGLAAAFKYNGIFLVCPYLAAIFISGFKPLDFKKLALAALAALGAFSLFNPYAWLDFTFFIQELAGEKTAREAGTGWMHHLVYSAAGGIGPAMLVLSFAGMTAVLLDRVPTVQNKARCVILAFVLPYYLVIVLWGQYYDRYILPLVPFLAFFAADAIGRFYASRSQIKSGTAITFILIAVTAIPPLTKSFLSSWLFSQADTRTEAKLWIESHLPAESRIAFNVPFYAPRLGWSRDKLLEIKQRASEQSRFSSAQKRRFDILLRQNETSGITGYELYQLVDSPDADSAFLFGPKPLHYAAEAVVSSGIDFLVVSRHAGDKKLAALFSEFDGTPEKLARFSPYRSAFIENTLDPIAMTGGPFLWRDLIARRAPGPVIEVYAAVKEVNS